jgi:mono/diheme cytochrome c family protein
MIRRPWHLPALLAVVLPPMILGLAVTAWADASPSPASGAAALPGDPKNGETVYAQNCATCHGPSLGGGIGPRLNPITKLGNVDDPKDPQYLIDTVTNGLSNVGPYHSPTDMPVFGGKLSDAQIKDVVSYILEQNTKPPGLTPGELARSTTFWVAGGILVMLAITYLLAKYNMRWVARKAQIRRSQ